MSSVGVPEVLFILVLAGLLFGGRILSGVSDVFIEAMRRFSRELDTLKTVPPPRIGILQIFRWLTPFLFLVLGLRLIDISNSASNRVGHRISPVFGGSFLVIGGIALVDAVLAGRSSSGQRFKFVRVALMAAAFCVLVVGFIFRYSN